MSPFQAAEFSRSTPNIGRWIAIPRQHPSVRQARGRFQVLEHCLGSNSNVFSVRFADQPEGCRAGGAGLVAGEPGSKRPRDHTGMRTIIWPAWRGDLLLACR